MAACGGVVTAADLAARLPDDLDTLVDVIESELGRPGRRGISPARAARHARCTTGQARQVIAYLYGRQRAHTSSSWNHIHPHAA